MSSSSQHVSMLPTPPSTQETPSSSKKRKTDDTNTLKENQKRAANAGLWFTDGNIIIVAQSTPFRVHQSVISQQSVVFRNLCRLAAMGACEFLDNVPLVRTTDNWRDFSDLLKAIYNSQEFFGFRQTIQFETVSALLRLGNKYGLAHLEQEAVARLERLFPSSLSEFKNGHTDAHSERENIKIFCPDSRIEMVSSDAIEAINLARAYTIPSILPSAFYICSRLPILYLTKGDSNTRGATNVLNPIDLAKCLTGQLELTRRYVVTTQTLDNEVGHRCDNAADSCIDRTQKIHGIEHRDSVSTRQSNALGSCLLSSEWITDDDDCYGICDKCSLKRMELWDEFRQTTWDDLSTIFSLNQS